MLAGTKTAKLSLYGPLDYWDNLGTKFVDDINKLEGVEAIHVHINSPGGNMGDGVAIYNVLKQHEAHVKVIIDAFAASAASIVAMAGDEIVMPANTLMMIHEPETYADGRRADMLKAAEVLEKHLNQAVTIYVERTGLPDDEIRNMLTEETWFTAEEALAKGFCTEVIESYKIAASYDPVKNNFKNAPVEALAKLMEEPTMAGEEQPKKPYNAVAVMEAVSNAGLPAVVAMALVRREADDATVQARIKSAGEIVTLCTNAKLPELSTPLIRVEMTAEEAKEFVANVNAIIDERAPTSTANNGGAPTTEPKPEDKAAEAMSVHNKALSSIGGKVKTAS